LTPPRPIIACTSSDGTEKNQTCKDEGPLIFERRDRTGTFLMESKRGGIPFAVDRVIYRSTLTAAETESSKTSLTAIGHGNNQDIHQTETV
jgi:hypothetical protein